MANGNPHPSSLGPFKPLTSQGDRVYLDYNATTPVMAELLPKIQEWLEHWGNPSSIHWSGRGPKALLRDSRRALAAALGCDALELVFTSGGSESNNLAIKGVFLSRLKRGVVSRNQYLMSAVEHPSVQKAMEQLRLQGAVVETIAVDRKGQIDLEQFKKQLSPHTSLVSVMAANNETGHVMPIQEMARLTHEAGALFHCDAVQALGKLPIDLHNWDVDLATFSAHKFYALKGCGLLYVKRGVQLESLISGGGQERGRRAGTENLLSLAAFGAVVPHLVHLEDAVSKMRTLRDLFENEVLNEISGIQITGREGERLPNTSSLVLDRVDGETLLMNLDLRGFSVSTGAACSSGNPEPSPVLLNMGLSRREAQSSLRVSLGWSTSQEDIMRFVVNLKEVVARLRHFQHGHDAHLEL